MATALEIKNISKTFGALRVVREVSLKLPVGARHGLIGANGAGKTTLFNLLSGELRADAGSMHMSGVDITRWPPHARTVAGLGRSFQQSALFDEWTVLQNLALACALHQGLCPVFWRRLQRITAVWDAACHHATRVGLADVAHSPVTHLSYGARRQLELGMTLATAPRVLLLDEPTAGLSPHEVACIKDLVRGLPAHMTVLIIEHDLDVVFELAECVTVLDYGHILAQGAPAEIRASKTVREKYFGYTQMPLGDISG